MNAVSNLLNRVASISTKYESLSKITGESFNIFSLLRMDADEVKAHSTIIAELLKPSGMHNLGDVFLREFLIIIKIPDFETTGCQVEVEKYAGRIDENFEEGGRIDILVTGKDKSIIIENKIYAEDQFRQFRRYLNFRKDARLVYLTLDGKTPSKDSTDGLSEEVIQSIICLSYKSEIIEWLEQCKKHAVDHSLLRETITQYINLLKKLTGQTINHQMSDEVKSALIGNAANFNAAKSIYAEYKSAQTLIAQAFWQHVGELLVKELGEGWKCTLLQSWGILIHPKDIYDLGYCIDFNVEREQSHIGIYKHLEYNKDGKKYYSNFINKKASDSKYNFLTSGWHLMNSAVVENGSIFTSQNLLTVLPLRNESFFFFAKETAQRISSYVNDPLNREFIVTTSKEIAEVKSRLKSIKASLDLRVKNVKTIDIYEGYVLYANIEVPQNITLAVDLLAEDGIFNIEVLVRGISSREEVDRIFSGLKFFANVDLTSIERTTRHGVRLRPFKVGSLTEDIVDEMFSIIERIVPVESEGA